MPWEGEVLGQPLGAAGQQQGRWAHMDLVLKAAGPGGHMVTQQPVVEGQRGPGPEAAGLQPEQLGSACTCWSAAGCLGEHYKEMVL